MYTRVCVLVCVRVCMIQWGLVVNIRWCGLPTAAYSDGEESVAKRVCVDAEESKLTQTQRCVCVCVCA